MLVTKCLCLTLSPLFFSFPHTGRYERLQSQMTTSHKIMAEVKDLEDVVGHKEMKMSSELNLVRT